jgi:hypothetical protein
MKTTIFCSCYKFLKFCYAYSRCNNPIIFKYGLELFISTSLFRLIISLWRAYNLTVFLPCLTGPVDYPFASHHKGPGFKSPGGYLCETGILLLALSHYIGDPDVIDHFCGFVWGRLRLRQASSRTITRPLCRQCGNPTWSHTALLSQFYARCRFSFQLYNQHSRLLGGNPVEILQSHCVLTMSHWSSVLPICFPSQGTQV